MVNALMQNKITPMFGLYPQLIENEYKNRNAIMLPVSPVIIPALATER